MHILKVLETYFRESQALHVHSICAYDFTVFNNFLKIYSEIKPFTSYPIMNKNPIIKDNIGWTVTYFEAKILVQTAALLHFQFFFFIIVCTIITKIIDLTNSRYFEQKKKKKKLLTDYFITF